MNSDNENEEREHFQKIVNVFKSYRTLMMKKITDKESFVKSLPSNHQSVLDSYVRHLSSQKTCIEHNTEVIQLIVKDVENMFENVQHGQAENVSLSVAPGDLDKLQSTIRQLVRDWSESGDMERRQCYQPIINQIEELFPTHAVCARDVQILVPGAGLGRLAYELAKRGYSCQGNEFSLFMLFASNFVLNRCKGLNSLKIFPWVHNGSNLLKSEDQLQEALIPDVDPSNLPSESQFTMAAGDFLEIYTEDSVWDCVATSFFIDCAHNIVSFIETIYKILKPGGYWVNLGPLLYHFADQQSEESIEPSYEVIRNVIKSFGFIFVVEKTGLRTTYTQPTFSMLKHEYESLFFVVQKPT